MKRLIIFTLSIFLCGFFYNQVKGMTPNGKTAIYQTDKKSKIKMDELPQAVKDSLSTGEFKGWSMTSNIYKIKTNTAAGYYYQVELQKDMRTLTINLDPNGKKLSDVDLTKE